MWESNRSTKEALQCHIKSKRNVLAVGKKQKGLISLELFLDCEQWKMEKKSLNLIATIVEAQNVKLVSRVK